MTTFPSYQAFPGAEPPPQYPAAPPPILVAAADPAPQRRWTVLLRLILAVPHFVVLYILAFVAGIIAFLGWWGALFTGRLPEFAVTFLGGYLRWYTRFAAYVGLLTDVYPPFSFDDDPGYPVRLAVPPAQRLNRAAVFFRCILIIPAWFVASVVGSAFTPIGLIAWLITLVSGRLPRSLHLAHLAVVRYQARLYGYGWLLTPAYPGGLYGDGQATASWADAPAPGYVAPGYVAPGYVAPGYGVPGGYGVAGEYGQPAFQPATWLVRLTTGARRWVTAFIVIGTLCLAGGITLYVIGIAAIFSGVDNGVRAELDLAQLGTSRLALNRTSVAWESSVVNCDHKLACLTKQDAKPARAFGLFADQMRTAPVPALAAADQRKLIGDANTLEFEFTSLSKARTDAEYQVTLTATGLQQDLIEFDKDYQALVDRLRRPATLP